MRVKNINTTSQNKCKCGSWLQHWKNYSGQLVYTCVACECTNTDLVGAHVQKDVNYDNSWYIVPFCKAHNKANEPVELVANTNLVSAYKNDTCN